MKWYADGKEVHVGDTIDKAFEAGVYTLKILAVTTMGKETSRTMALTVKPLADDPVTEEKPAERLQSPGTVAKVSGKHQSTITAVSIGGHRLKSPAVMTTIWNIPFLRDWLTDSIAYRSLMVIISHTAVA